MSWKFIAIADRLHVGYMGILVQVTTKWAKAIVYLPVIELRGYNFSGGE